jgi:hypothetical protein
MSQTKHNWMQGETGHSTLSMQAHQLPTYLPSSYSSTVGSPHAGQDSSQWTSRLSNMLDNVIAHYHLRNIATPNGYVYCKIRQGMYGLLQAGIIAQELLAKRLKEYGYTQIKTMPGL